MKIEFEKEDKFFYQEKNPMLQEIAKEALIFLCERIEEIEEGINVKTLFYLCKRMKEKIPYIKFKSIDNKEIANKLSKEQIIKAIAEGLKDVLILPEGTKIIDAKKS